MSDVKIELLKIAQSLVENNIYRELEKHNYDCQVSGEPLPYPKTKVTLKEVVDVASELERTYINSNVQTLRG